MSEEGFFSRWARRKKEVRSGQASEETPAAAAAPASAGPQAGGSAAAVPPAGVAARGPAPEGAGAASDGPRPAATAAEAEPPLPSMDDVARLTRDSDYSGFMRRGVDADVRRAAMKKLFTDPHYNVMDGLDIYIDDYSKPDPIPMAMLRKMKQSQLLGLFRDEEDGADAALEAAPAVADAPPAAAATDDSGAAAVAQSRADAAAAADGPAADAAAAPREPDDERVAAAGDASRDRPDDDGAVPPAGPTGPAGRS